MHFHRMILVPALVLTLCCLGYGWEGVVETTTHSYEVQGKPQLILRNPDGKIKLTPGPEGTVQVTITKEVRRAKDEADAKKQAESVHVDLDQTGNRIEAETRWPTSGWFHLGIYRQPQVTITYEIIAPNVSDIRAGVADGTLLADGFSGNLELSTVDGELSVSHLSGTLTISGVDGRVDVSDSTGTMALSITDGKLNATKCSGALTVRASDGTVQMHGIEGTLDARAGDGKLTVDGILKSVSAKMVDGKMDVQLLSGSTIDKDSSLSSTDGDILLRIPEDLKADLELSTSDGRINTQVPIMITGSFKSNRLTGKLNDGGNLLSIRTSDGDIQIER